MLPENALEDARLDDDIHQLNMDISKFEWITRE
jgi:hypothetical protein